MKEKQDAEKEVIPVTKKDGTAVNGKRNQKMTFRTTPAVKNTLIHNAKKRNMSQSGYIEYCVLNDDLSGAEYDPAAIVKMAIKVQEQEIEDREAMKQLFSETKKAISVLPGSDSYQKEILTTSMGALFSAYACRSDIRNQELYQLISEIPTSMGKERSRLEDAFLMKKDGESK